jgi:superfamily II DNA or RNA helicase
MPTTLKMYNLSVALTTDNSNLKQKIDEFIYRYYTQKQSSYGNATQLEYKLYSSKVGNTYTLHNNQFKHLYHHLKTINYPLHVDSTEKYLDYDVAAEDIALRDGWELRDYQEPIVDFIIQSPARAKLVPIQTGRGKGICSLAAIARLKHRVGVVILPTFIEKWVEEIAQTVTVKTKDIMVVQGQKNLRALIELAKEDAVTNPFVIFSSRTLQEFIVQYEQTPEAVRDISGIEPIELFPLLKIGTLLIDESHMHFHALYKILLYTNVKNQIGLTATMLSDDQIVKNIQSIVYPEEARYSGLAHDQYIDVYPIQYTIGHGSVKHIRTTEYNSNNYSHQAVEKSIMRNKLLRDKYFLLIKELIDDYYIEGRSQKDRLAIFVASVNMATSLTQYLTAMYPEYSVKRYCEDDPFENVTDPDMRVTTVISAGTGIDIKDLRVVIQTVSISSTVSNIQTLGRLRKLPDRDTKFLYLFSHQIKKQVAYHYKRKEIFETKARRIIDRAARTSL